MLSAASRPLCPACCAPVSAEQRFCGACGRPLPGSVGLPAPHPGARVERLRVVGERKLVTVLFADVVGSMELAERSGPELWRRVISRFAAMASGAVARYEGTVDKFTGDGVMAVFGAPVAQEDHARRACYAALDLLADSGELAARLRHEHGLSFAVRIGLNSGEVAVGPMGDERAFGYTALGHPVGLARRMEELAAPDAIYVTHLTAALVEGYVRLEALGRFNVKGASRPVDVSRVLGVGASSGWLDAARSRGLSRFVGRQAELDVLDDAFRRAQGGEGQVVGIVGEAGTGKSRLSFEFLRRNRQSGARALHVVGQSHTASEPLLPLVHLLRSYFDIDEGDSDVSARDRIRRGLASLDDALEEELPLLFDLLSVPDPERPAARIDPEARRRRLLGLLARMMRLRSEHEPGILVFEDLHWLDPASEAFLVAQIEAVRSTRSLLVLTFRPGYDRPWRTGPSFRELHLAPLDAGAVEEMVTALAGRDRSLDGLGEVLAERTGGNPLFVEEILRALAETGRLTGSPGALRLSEGVESIDVPPTVNAVLAARIDRLPERARTLLQIASVIGRELPHALLERISARGPEELRADLGTLVGAGFLVEDDVPGERRLVFRHPLARDIAYRSLLDEQRAPLHRAAADAIVDAFPDRLDERAATVAAHREASGESLAAARWHARAAAWAGTTDPASALRHWRRVGALARASSPDEESAALALYAQIASLEFGWRTGMSPDEARECFDAAQGIAAKAPTAHASAILLAIYGLIRGINEGALEECVEHVRRAVGLAEAAGDPGLLLAVSPVAYALLATGRYQAAIELCGTALERAGGDATLGSGVLVRCPSALCLAFTGGALSETGDLIAAERLLEDARRLAAAHDDIEAVGLAHSLSARVGYFCGDPDVARGHAAQALAIAERTGSPQSRVRAWLSTGLAEHLAGRPQAAVAALETSARLSREHRAAVDVDGWRLALLAECHLVLGDRSRAVRLARRGVDRACGQGSVFSEINARLALARCLASQGPRAIDAAARQLDEVELLAVRTGATTYLPFVEAERAVVAGRRGDAADTERLLRGAESGFRRMGAFARAGRPRPGRRAIA